MFCFIISNSTPRFLSKDQTYYLSWARNDTHLLSSNKFTSCQGRCATPPVTDLDAREVFEACLDRGSLSEHYLTIIVVSRNDNYGNFQYERFQNMLDSTFLMAEETKTSIELLIVEWNPDKNKRRIQDTYRFRRSEYLTYRILTVPQKIHDTFKYNTLKSVYEFEGKNFGIRHARGEFIVCTNQDDIWSNNMYQATQSMSWQKNMIYTQFQDEHSPENTVESTTLVQLSDFPTDTEIQTSCHTAIKNDTRQFSLPKQEMQLDQDNYLRIGHEASDFTLAHREVWMSVGGYREIGATIWIDVEFLLTAFHTKRIPITYSPQAFNCHQIHTPVKHKGVEFDNKDVKVEDIISNQVSYVNMGHWGLSHLDLYQSGLKCNVFRGGLGK
ncbi:hypothetical protein BDF21DRAFT_468436 [Thamnidium elegans]|nr:hypothetical protein BDF21DRAFT_468436 [Thamnidium elegans]